MITKARGNKKSQKQGFKLKHNQKKVTYIKI